MPLGYNEAAFIGIVLEGVFYGNLYFIYDVPMPQFISSIGLYCIMFVLYLRVHTSKKYDDRNVLIYPISSLFVLCTTFFVLDFTQQYVTVVSKTFPSQPWRWIDAHRPPDEGARREPSGVESELKHQYNLFLRRCHCSRDSGMSQS